MSDAEDIDVLAGEYVLGTLDAAERVAVAGRRRREPALDKAIAAWERRLGPLADTTPAVEPPAGLLRRIEARIDTSAARALGAPAAEIIQLERRVRRWQWLAGAASAAAALALVTVGVREATRPATVQSFFGVFNQGDVAPAFVLTVDLATKTLTIKTVGAQALPDKSYQLWIKTTPQSQPRSLGVIASGEHRVGAELATFRAEEVRGATFGVSIEPRGGSPIGQPTGNVLHAQLLPGRL